MLGGAAQAIEVYSGVAPPIPNCKPLVSRQWVDGVLDRPTTTRNGRQLATENGLAVIGPLASLVQSVVMKLAVRHSLQAVGSCDLETGGFDSKWAEPAYKLA